MWRCFKCGLENGYTTVCPDCGFRLENRDVAVEAMNFAPMVSDDSYVTLRSSGDGVCYVNDVPVRVPTDEPDPVPNCTSDSENAYGHKPPLGHRVFMASLRLVTAASIFTVTLVLAFFAVVFLKAFSG